MMDLTVISVSKKGADSNGQIGVVLKGGAEEVETSLGKQFIAQTYWTEVDESVGVDKHVFTDVDLNNFDQEDGTDGLIFLTPKALEA